eukprot:CAMPEP_0173229314 /NCGR_PEP_ID=MMETSP1142-20121109/7050_1 /TAXON_ID=483371 /ORGANISM="non described non described, Strain CCMP2298" /LENGTH=59 /DNA_ID=CAMNT_0014158127 /DNA_START=20 /DNA_END=199 /DNA_ORIENTATION=-
MQILGGVTMLLEPRAVLRNPVQRFGMVTLLITTLVKVTTLKVTTRIGVTILIRVTMLIG